MRSLDGPAVEKIGLMVELVSHGAEIGGNHPVFEEPGQPTLAGGFLS